MTKLICLFLVALAAWVAWKIIAARRRRKQHLQPVRAVIEQWCEATEKDIGGLEQQLQARRYPMAETAILYALRVSKCVERINSMKTLGSRWGVANSGPSRPGRASQAGLQAATGSPNYELAYGFLAHLYVARFAELVQRIAEKAEQSSLAAKSLAQKEKLLLRAAEKIDDAVVLEFDYTLPGLELAAERWTSRLNEQAERLCD